jgi:hypothetical protein
MGTAAVKTAWPEETVAAAAVAGSSVAWTAAMVSWLVAVHACSLSPAQDSLTVNLTVDQ